MIFTIGHKSSYEQYFREQGTPQKMGRNDEYPGGSVWKTFGEAKQYCPEGYEVYGVQADWERSTVKSEDGDWHDLLVTSDLVMLECQEEDVWDWWESLPTTRELPKSDLDWEDY